MNKEYNEDDYCDIYKNKICDNCGKCLEMEGIDIRAIKIEDISKTVEENKILEEEYERELNSLKESKKMNENAINDEELKREYQKLKDEGLLDDAFFDEEYEDAFDHIDYDKTINDEDLEENTDEVFPGVRKIKKKRE